MADPQHLTIPQAIADYSQAITLDPEHPAAYNNRGFIYYRTGDLDKAMIDFDQAIQLSPDEADAYYNRGYPQRSWKY